MPFSPNVVTPSTDWLDRLAIKTATRAPRRARNRQPSMAHVPNSGDITRRAGLKLAAAGFATAALGPVGALLKPAVASAAVDPCEDNLFKCLNASSNMDSDVRGILGCVQPLPVPTKEPIGKQLRDFLKSKVIAKVFHKVPILGQAECFGELAYQSYRARGGCYDSFTQCSKGGPPPPPPPQPSPPPPPPPSNCITSSCEQVGGLCCGPYYTMTATGCVTNCSQCKNPSLGPC